MKVKLLESAIDSMEDFKMLIDDSVPIQEALTAAGFAYSEISGKTQVVRNLKAAVGSEVEYFTEVFTKSTTTAATGSKIIHVAPDETGKIRVVEETLTEDTEVTAMTGTGILGSVTVSSVVAFAFCVLGVAATIELLNSTFFYNTVAKATTYITHPFTTMIFSKNSKGEIVNYMSKNDIEEIAEIINEGLGELTGMENLPKFYEYDAISEGYYGNIANMASQITDEDQLEEFIALTGVGETINEAICKPSSIGDNNMGVYVAATHELWVLNPYVDRTSTPSYVNNDDWTPYTRLSEPYGTGGTYNSALAEKTSIYNRPWISPLGEYPSLADSISYRSGGTNMITIGSPYYKCVNYSYPVPEDEPDRPREKEFFYLFHTMKISIFKYDPDTKTVTLELNSDDITEISRSAGITRITNMFTQIHSSNYPDLEYLKNVAISNQGLHYDTSPNSKIITTPDEEEDPAVYLPVTAPSANPETQPEAQTGESTDDFIEEDVTNDTDQNPSTDPVPKPDPQPDPNPDPDPDPDDGSDTTDTDDDADNDDDGTTPTVTPHTVTPSGMYGIYNPTATILQKFAAWLWATDSPITALKQFLNDPMQSILGLHAIYVDVSSNVAGTKAIGVGHLVATDGDSNLTANYITNPIKTLDCGTIYLGERYGSAIDYNGANLSIYLPFIGIKNIDINTALRGKIHVSYNIDIITGSCIAQIRIERDDMNAILYEYPGNCSCQLPLTSANYSSTISSLAGVVVSAAGTVATGGATAPMLVGAGASLLNAGMGSIERSGSFSSVYGALSHKKPYLIIERTSPIIPTTNNQLNGYNSANSVYIKSLTSDQFHSCKSVYFNSKIATQSEYSEIENILKSGFYV